MKIILHADDFGFDENTCQATIELFEKGALTSATIMANMPATDMALKYAKEHPEFSFGVHLTYVDGLTPVSLSSTIPSLVDGQGVFLSSNDVRKRAILLKLGHQDIVKESCAQIRKVQDYGIRVSHIDSHGHLHKFPSFLFALSDICKATGINKVRRVQNIFLTKPSFSLKRMLNLSFDKYICSKFINTDTFYMPANSMDVHWENDILGQINSISPEKTLELGVHPGFLEEWKKNEYNDVLAFSQMAKHNHEFINWNNL